MATRSAVGAFAAVQHRRQGRKRRSPAADRESAPGGLAGGADRHPGQRPPGGALPCGGRSGSGAIRAGAADPAPIRGGLVLGGTLPLRCRWNRGRPVNSPSEHGLPPRRRGRSARGGSCDPPNTTGQESYWDQHGWTSQPWHALQRLPGMPMRGGRRSFGRRGVRRLRGGRGWCRES